MKKKQNRNLLKVATTHFLVTSMMYSSFAIIPVNAQEQAQVSAGMQTAVDITKAAVGMSQQFFAQQQAQQQQLMMMQQMNSMKPQLVPSKYFGCPVGPSMATMPSDNMCPKKPDASNFPMLQTYRSMRDMAEQNAHFFEKLLNEGQNSPQMVGVQCLNDRMKRSMDQMQDQINSLQDMADKIAKENQTFREQNKQLLDQMRDINADLNGNTNNLASKNAKTFGELLNPNCVQYIGGSKLENYKQGGGLMKLRTDQAAFNDLATQTMNKRPQMEKDLISQINLLKKNVNTLGIEAFIDGKVPFDPSKTQTQFNIGAAMAPKSKQIYARIQTIRDNLKSELNYELPILDGNFMANSADLRNNAERFFKKKFINECARSDLDLSNRQLLDSLKHSTSTNNDMLARYRSALEGILGDSSIPADVKVTRIKDLDKVYGNKVQVKFSDNAGRDAFSTPYEYLNSVIKDCESNLAYNNIDDANTGNRGKETALNQLGSQQQKIQAGMKYLDELTGIVKTAVNDIANDIYNEIANCGGAAVEVSTCSSQDTYKSSSETFCIKKAVNCSQQVNSCYREIDNAIKTRQTQINTIAATYDKNVAQLVSNQERFLGMVKSRVAQYQQFMATTFPGTKVELPGVKRGADKDDGLFVKMPEKELNQEFGVYLRGGGDIEEFDKLPEKIIMMKEMLAAQKSKVESEIKEYIAQQKAAAEKNMKKWQDVAKNCQATAEGVVAAAQKMQEAQMKQAAEAKKKQDEYCSKFQELKNAAGAENPAAGCGKPLEALSSTMKDVSQGLVSDGSVKWYNDYSRYCRSVQATGEQKEDKDEDEEEADESSLLANACKASGNTSQSALNSIIAKIKGLDLVDEDELDAIAKKLSEATSADAITSEVFPLIEKVKDSKVKNALVELANQAKKSMADATVRENYPNGAKSYAKEKGICFGVKESAIASYTSGCSETGTCSPTKDIDDVFFAKQNVKGALDSLFKSSSRGVASANKEKFNNLGLGQMDKISCLAKDDTSRGLAGSLQDLQNQIFKNDAAVLGIGK